MMTHVSNPVLDFRSDTVTRPTQGMRAAMAAAEVGDDVFDEDPSINRLQAKIAEMLGHEAALFVPSGTMSNQIGVRLHCRPGDEFICESGCHIYNYEQGAFAQLSGLVARTVDGEQGVLRLEQLQGLVRGENEHVVRTRLVTLENTHNRGAGKVQPYEGVKAICDWAHESGLVTHLDGARLFNAVVATGIKADRWAEHFDTVSVCFSKGLGAPVGSALVGPKEMMKQGRRVRKLFGGGMRQAGVLAAAAIYALDHHIERLADDHENAQLLANAIKLVPYLKLHGESVDTNMVIFNIEPTLGTAAQFCTRLAEEGLLMLAIGAQQVRAVTHLDVTADDARRAGGILIRVVEQAEAGQKPALKSGVMYA